MSTVVTSERPFIAPNQLATSSSTSQLTRLVSSSQTQYITITSDPALQSSRLVSKAGNRSQTITLDGKMPLTQSIGQVTKLQTTSWSSDMPDLQTTGLVDQNFSSQALTCKKVLPTSSLAGSVAVSQDPDSDLEQYSYPSFLPNPMEEEGKVSDQDTATPEQELDRQLSDEQNYQET